MGDIFDPRGPCIVRLCHDIVMEVHTAYAFLRVRRSLSSQYLGGVCFEFNISEMQCRKTPRRSTTPSGNFPASTNPTNDIYSVADGVASLLPDGGVLVMASPVRNGVPFQTPSNFFEFRPDNTMVDVTDSPNAASFVAYQGRMLLLPTGQV